MFGIQKQIFLRTLRYFRVFSTFVDGGLIGGDGAAVRRVGRIVLARLKWAFEPFEKSGKGRLRCIQNWANGQNLGKTMTQRT